MNPNLVSLYFRNSNIAFLTKHKKERIVAPLLEPFLGTKVIQVNGYDTDKLGTFTREIRRVDTQLETAKRKARIGMELSDLKYALGSEGSFCTDPYTGLVPWNIEMMVFVDDEKGLEICGIAQGPATILQKTSRHVEGIEQIAKEFGFPENGMVLRPDNENNEFIIKDVQDIWQLREAAKKCLESSIDGQVFIENDLRAHACPARREMIGLATINLLLKMSSLCPNCSMPGFWMTDDRPGLPCEFCKRPTDVFAAQIYTCQVCGYIKELKRPDRQYAEQFNCSYCNP